MKRRNAGILLGILISAVMIGCGSQEKEAIETWKGTEGETEAKTDSAKDKKKKTSEKKKETKETKETKEESEEASKKETEKDTAPSSREEQVEAAEETESPEEVVGLLFPTDELDEEWAVEAKGLADGLLEAGYDGQIRYANGSSALQEEQIREFMKEDVEAMILAPADIYSLGEVLDEVREAGIPVFSYDLLAMDTKAVNYYFTFDTRAVGQKVAGEIVKKLDLEKAQEEKLSYNIEFLMGSIDDSQALFFYNGVMEILQPYLDDGTLVCQSQKTSFDETGVLRWSEEAAQADLSAYLAEFYQDESLDVVCAASDTLANSAVKALEEAGIAVGSEEWPIITGVGCEQTGVQNIASGAQALSVFMDPMELMDTCLDTVVDYLDGTKPEKTNYEQYDNGRKIISTVLADFKMIDGDNYQLLLDKGYFDEAAIFPTVTEAPEEIREEETEETSEEKEEEAREI